MSVKNWFIDCAKGAALGTGILPGVSVGTVGIFVNVYDKLIEGFNGLRKNFLKSFLTLLPIAVGCLISAVLLLVFWKKVAYVYFPFVIIAALAGFVIGGLPILTKELSGERISGMDILRIAIGFLVASSIGILSFLSAAGVVALNLDFQVAFDAPFVHWWVFLVVLFVGFLAAVACLIPGISGSMILFIFALYNPVVNLLMNGKNPDGTEHLSIFHDTSKLGGGLLLLGTLLIGIVIGFLSASKAMGSLLEHHRRGTFGVVLGFVAGSLVSMFVNNDMYAVYVNPTTNQPWQFVLGGVLLVLVAALTFFLLKRRSKTQENDP